ncbi:U32 family peptidase [Chamaesiphon minutus]|uniref:Collagenase-like protease n=1 Tax=Chamaesiphon minutus (strain ATCC 27169 / PCC 6605) TaxID=1173020 RepID=K9UM45_CHAP6|nr:U32 family peptidase [Chamaesiphon minutus]AFY95516.1 collagenase-like protease [Chamaesiphon minutus PCC 6605]
MPTPTPTLTRIHRPLLLAPAGNWECAKAAIENGADAIYFGLERFNARMRAENFTEGDLPELMAWLHQRGVKGYVTMNTLVFPQELPAAEQYLRSIILAGVDAAIVQDVGLCKLIRHLSPDFPIHASTQMTVTSAAGAEFAHELGCNLVVLARECSLKEIDKIQAQLSDREISIPLEVFVHGALCVAYSGQCLTSESLGGRSANRGECAQACRMPYDLIVDGEYYHLGDKKYLLSPQDLAGLNVLPEIIKSGVSCLKIEGRLKTPEYVASVTKVYRSALDRIVADLGISAEPDRDLYNLEMAFSRGLYTGWFEGINNQALVHARFGKKRGVYLGEVTRVYPDREAIAIDPIAPIKAGDGIVFDCGHPEDREEGGRVYEVFKNERQSEVMLSFGRGAVNFRQVYIGDKVWKTSDPELDKQVRQTYAGDVPKFQRSIDLEIHGEINQPLIAIARDEVGYVVQVESEILLVAAQNQPLTTDKLSSQLGRLGNTPFRLGSLTNHLVDDLMLPVSALNQIRRELVTKLTEARSQPKSWQLSPTNKLTDLLPEVDRAVLNPPQLIILVRKLDQIPAAIESGIATIYCELEDPRKYHEAVQLVRAAKSKSNPPQIFVAPPRITKPGENWILEQVRSSDADGYLIRNYDHLEFFKTDRCIGDFALNVANPLTADYFYQNYTFDRLTASYDLNIDQLTALIRSCPRDWFEVTIHQHMPMFHMEHCVFCTFLSEGTDYTNCGRPCDEHQVKLRDRVGTEHILQADAGCRNTVFNGVAQTGAEYIHRLVELGVYNFRLEFVNESPQTVSETIGYYQQLLGGQISGTELWKSLQLSSQLGVTRGSLGV